MRPLVPIRYVKVRDVKAKRTYYLMLTRDDAKWLGGHEVGKDGGRLVETTPEGIDLDILHLIHRSAMASGEVKITPMRMNFTFAELELP